jgi:toxin ParE1/3/4
VVVAVGHGRSEINHEKHEAHEKCAVDLVAQIFVCVVFFVASPHFLSRLSDNSLVFELREVADRLIDAIDDAASTYAGQPHLGVPRSELAKDVRCFPVGSYVVFYLAAGDGIEVIQVIHGSRDIPLHFRR